MSPKTSRPALRTAEFIPLIALLISLDALSTDAMLPALSTMARELGAARANDAQFVITSLFLGLGIGQLLFGPLSDRIGRKPAIYGGLALFMAGCLVSLFASTFEAMIAGRMLQGIGVAAPHVVTMALVRDQYEGRLMARLMSLALAVFILVPTVAPALGSSSCGSPAGAPSSRPSSRSPLSLSRGSRCVNPRRCPRSAGVPSRLVRLRARWPRS